MQQSAGHLSSKKASWKLLHSLWIGWTFTLLFSWLAFAYIGIRSRRSKWTLWAIVYASPLIVFAVFSGAPQRWIGNIALTVAVVLGLLSIAHAFWVRREYLIYLEMLDHQVSAVSATSRGKRWERLHSFWMLWTLPFGFTSWIAFLYIGVRTRQSRWLLWGTLYFALFIAFAVSEPLFGRHSEISEAIVGLFIVSWIVSVVHAFSVRLDYLMKLENSSDEILPGEVGDPMPQTGQMLRSEKLPEDQVGLDSVTSDRTSRSLDVTKKNAVKRPQTSVDTNAVNVSATPHLKRGSAEVSDTYPLPLAYGWSLLGSLWDPRDRYREQLRHAENMLALLGSISLALLEKEDHRSTGIDLGLAWQRGISFGGWKALVQLSSEALRAKDHPLGTSIYKLRIRSENKGFGADIARLISMRNDFHHGRGPLVQEDVAAASVEAQDRLERCMEALSFLAGYPIRLIQDFDINRDSSSFSLKCLRLMGDGPGFPQEGVEFPQALPRGDLVLDKGDGEWVSLHPFIVASNCPRCRYRETYFIDRWNSRKNLVLMKSFERGHPEERSDVSEALASLVTEQDTKPTATP